MTDRRHLTGVVTTPMSARVPADLWMWLRDYAAREGLSNNLAVTLAMQEFRLAHDEDAASG